MGIGKLLGNPDEILGGGGGEEWGPCDGLSSHSGESNDTAGRFIPSFIPTGISFSWGPLGLSADFILVKWQENMFTHFIIMLKIYYLTDSGVHSSDFQMCS